METRAVSEIKFREDLYPRFEPCQKTIQKYAYSVNFLPPVKISQGNILIDGFHRWKAHQLDEQKTINVEVVEVASEKELKKLAYQYNSHHGIQLKPEEKERYAQEMIGEQMTIEELAQVLSVGETTIKRWTDSQRKTIKAERDRKAIESYLRAWNTQQSIADMLGVPQRTIARIIEGFSQKDQMVEMAKDFKPYIYNIWRKLEQDSSTESHFGSFPHVYMQNLLYYHSEPLDIIYDPFAGAGTTVDVCKEMFRRYYCSDRIVKPGREKDILEHEIAQGLPDNLPKIDMAFLDPPYWKQSEGMYSKDNEDLGNMSLFEFNKTIETLLSTLTKKKTKRIAVVIQPTQYKNNWFFTDHGFDFHKMISNKYEIEMRYILPYSTQQYNAQMVECAKKERRCLVLHRDLIVWRLNDKEKK